MKNEPRMSTYLAFAYNSFYPGGVLEDCVAVTTTQEEAVEMLTRPEYARSFLFRQIIKVEDGTATLVWEAFNSDPQIVPPVKLPLFVYRFNADGNVVGEEWAEVD